MISIEDLIPHRRSMKLIDTIISVDANSAETTATVRETWPLVTGKYVNPIIVIELMAQTTGICHGWKEFTERGIRNGGRGWIVGIKRADFLVPQIPIHSCIVTKVRIRFNYETYQEISGTAHVGSDPISRIALQVFQPSEP